MFQLHVRPTNAREEGAVVGFGSFLLCDGAIVNERSSLAGSLDVGHDEECQILRAGQQEMYGRPE